MNFNRVERGEVVVCPTSDGAPDAGNGFYQCHDFRCIMGSILWFAPALEDGFRLPETRDLGSGFAYSPVAQAVGLQVEIPLGDRKRFLPLHLIDRDDLLQVVLSVVFVFFNDVRV